jgi:hypothetical protein
VGAAVGSAVLLHAVKPNTKIANTLPQIQKNTDKRTSVFPSLRSGQAFCIWGKLSLADIPIIRKSD